METEGLGARRTEGADGPKGRSKPGRHRPGSAFSSPGPRPLTISSLSQTVGCTARRKRLQPRGRSLQLPTAASTAGLRCAVPRRGCSWGGVITIAPSPVLARLPPAGRSSAPTRPSASALGPIRHTSANGRRGLRNKAERGMTRARSSSATGIRARTRSHTPTGRRIPRSRGERRSTRPVFASDPFASRGGRLLAVRNGVSQWSGPLSRIIGLAVVGLTALLT